VGRTETYRQETFVRVRLGGRFRPKVARKHSGNDRSPVQFWSGNANTKIWLELLGCSSGASVFSPELTSEFCRLMLFVVQRATTALPAAIERSAPNREQEHFLQWRILHFSPEGW
jgi:hypothetical protein